MVGVIGRDSLNSGSTGGEREATAPPSTVYLVDASDLRPLQARPPFAEYCRQLWERRFFIGADARAKALRGTKDYRLWRLWLVLEPALDVAFYAFLFGFLLRTSRGIENFLGFLIIGVIFMRMLTSLLSQGSLLIRTSRGMIQTFQFPKASLILSQTLRNVIDNVIPAAIAIVSALLFQLEKPLHWTILLIVPLYFMIHVFGCGLMLFTARLTAEIPDTRALIKFGTQAWFFLSGVMYSVSRFADNPTLHAIMTANPGYIFLTALRDSVLYGSAPLVSTWLTLGAWTFGTFIAGLIYFWMAEAKYVRLT